MVVRQSVIQLRVTTWVDDMFVQGTASGAGDDGAAQLAGSRELYVQTVYEGDSDGEFTAACVCADRCIQVADIVILLPAFCLFVHVLYRKELFTGQKVPCGRSTPQHLTSWSPDGVAAGASAATSSNSDRPRPLPVSNTQNCS